MEADILDMESFNQHEAGLGEKEQNAWKGKVGEGMVVHESLTEEEW